MVFEEITTAKPIIAGMPWETSGAWATWKEKTGQGRDSLMACPFCKKGECVQQCKGPEGKKDKKKDKKQKDKKGKKDKKKDRKKDKHHK